MSLPYLIMYLAALPLPERMRNLFMHADYSYGLYIYAFPIAQLIVLACFPHLTVASLACLTIIAALPFSAASWHIIEKPALALGRNSKRD